MDLEKQILLHRYCYYILADPILPDSEYDKIEREARRVLPSTSVVHKIGSSLSKDYSEEIKTIAHKIKRI